MDIGDDKMKIAFRLTKDKVQLIDKYVGLSSCRSRNEFMEEAIDFYCDYITSKNNNLLPISVTSAIEGTLKQSEDRISRLLFKNTVELSMLMTLMAHATDIDEDVLNKLRAKCVKDIKSTNGRITFEEIIRYQKE